MQQLKKIGNISGVVGQTKQGKKIYRTFGSLMQREDSSFVVVLDTTMNLLSAKHGTDINAWLSVYADKNQVTEQTQAPQESITSCDDIPF